MRKWYFGRNDRRPLKKMTAVELAWRGLPIEAIRILEAASASATECVSLAELNAFMGDWARAASNAVTYLMESQGAHASSVFDDMLHLLIYSGKRGVSWVEISHYLDCIREAVSAEFPEGRERERQLKWIVAAKKATTTGGIMRNPFTGEINTLRPEKISEA